MTTVILTYSSTINAKTILVIEVYRGNLLPYYLKNHGIHEGVYIRIGATNRKASYMNILERQRKNISYDEIIKNLIHLSSEIKGLQSPE